MNPFDVGAMVISPQALARALGASGVDAARAQGYAPRLANTLARTPVGTPFQVPRIQLQQPPISPAVGSRHGGYEVDTGIPLGAIRFLALGGAAQAVTFGGAAGILAQTEMRARRLVLARQDTTANDALVLYTVTAIMTDGNLPLVDGAGAMPVDVFMRDSFGLRLNGRSVTRGSQIIVTLSNLFAAPATETDFVGILLGEAV